MRTRSTALAALTAAVLASPLAFAATPAAPQVTDAAGDANFLSGQGYTTAGPGAGNNSTPVGSQAYADVLSVLWTPDTAKVGKKTKTVGFTVTATLSGAPTPPSGTIVVYRMLGQVGGDSLQFLGPVWYSSPLSDATAPQAALRDNLSGTTRLTKIDLPKIEGSTITWKVPLTAVPKEFKAGSTLGNLYFEVREIEDFKGQKVPADVPVLGGASGGGYGLIDSGTSTSSFKVG
jgi:hypothetical protein